MAFAGGGACGGKGGGGSGPPAPVPGPSSWYSQYRLPTSSNLRAVRANGALSVIVAGDATSIFRSDDGGARWVQIEHRPASRGGDIKSMDYVNAHLQCVGSDSKFPAKGRVWTAINGVLDFVTPDLDANLNPNVADYVCVNVVSDDTYYALRSDGVVERSVAGFVTPLPALPAIAGGGSWTSISFLGTTGVGFAAGDKASIAKYIGGPGWLAQTTPVTAPVYNLKKVFFVDSLHAYACGDNATILATADAGATPWTSLNFASGGVAFHSLHFPVSFTIGWIVGDGGAIVKYDAGTPPPLPPLTLQPPSPPILENLWDVWFVDNSNGYAVGDHGWVLRTSNAGLLWDRVPPQIPIADTLTTLNAVDFTNNGSVGLVVGNGGLILMTTDGGVTWSVQANADTNDLFGVTIPKAGTGNVAYACGATGRILKGDLTVSPSTWTIQTSGTVESLRAILSPNSDILGFAVGDNGALVRTADGGATPWAAPTKPAGTPALKSLCSDAGGANFFASGSAGTVWSAASPGTTWGVYAGPGGTGAVTFNSVQTPAAGVKVLAGSDGKSYVELVGVWQTGVTIKAATTPLGMSFADSMNGWTVNSPVPFTGGLFGTSDGALTWQQSYVHTKWQLRAVWTSPLNPALVYAVGDNGTILKTTTGGQ